MKTRLMPSFYVFLCLPIFPKIIHSQSTINGTVKDENGPLCYASVILLQPSDSALVRYGVTDDRGAFSKEYTTQLPDFCSNDIPAG